VNVTVCHCTDLAALTELIGCSVFRDLNNYRSTAGIIYELLLAKSGLGVISSLCVTDIDFIINYMCVL